MSATTNQIVKRQPPRAQLARRGDAYDYQVETYIRWMEETGRTDPFASIGDYFKALNESTYKAGTIRLKRSAVKNRLRMLAEAQGLDPQRSYELDLLMRRLDQDPATKAPKINNAGVAASKTVSESEYEKLIVGARSLRQQLFIHFLWQTGCRVSEMVTARVGECVVEGSIVQVRVMGKGRKERVVRITTELFRRIRGEFAGNTFLFETSGGKHYNRSYVSNQISKLAMHLLGRKISAHKLRHSFATRMIAKTHKISAVSAYMGHSSVSTTLAMYNHEELDDVELLGIGVTA